MDTDVDVPDADNAGDGVSQSQSAADAPSTLAPASNDLPPTGTGPGTGPGTDPPKPDLDAKLSENLLTWFTDKGRWRTGNDTLRNRELVATSVARSKQDQSQEKDEKFRNISESEEPAKVEATEDKTCKMIQECTLGNAMVDVRWLSTAWDPKLGDIQRPLKLDHVQKLVDSFKTKLSRVQPDKRLLVSMTKADFDRCCDATDTQLQYESGRTKQLVTDSGHRYQELEDVPLLWFPPDHRPDAHIEAGQHRSRALLQLATEISDVKNDQHDDTLMGSSVRAVALEARKSFGWTVTILDRELLRQRPLVLQKVRRNDDNPYEVDSAGTTFHQACLAWGKFTESELQYWEANFDKFGKQFMGVSGSETTRLKRIFTTGGIRVVAQQLTSTLWGRDLYTQQNMVHLIKARSAVMVKRIMDDLYSRLLHFLSGSYTDPGKVHDPATPAPLIDTIMHISAWELEAMAECFVSGNFNRARWTALFFPLPPVAKEHVFKVPRYAEAPEVPQESNRLQTSRSSHHDERHHRRPMFLTFLNDSQYEQLFDANWEKCLGWVREPNPIVAKEGVSKVTIPTKMWFKRLVEVDLVKFYHVLKFHWWCAEPSQYKTILALGAVGSGSTRNVERVDVYDKFLIHYREFAEAQAIKKQPQDGDMDDDDDDNVLSAKSREKQLGNTRRIVEEVAKADQQVIAYTNALFAILVKHHGPLKDVIEGCQIPESLISSITPATVLSFFRQLLSHNFMKPCFEDAYSRHLDADSLTGLSRVTGVVQSIKPDDDRDRRVTQPFWDFSVTRDLSLRSATTSLVASYKPMHNIGKARKQSAIDSLEPILDIFTNSVALEILTEQYTSLLRDWRQNRADPVEEDDDFWAMRATPSGEIASYAAFLDAASYIQSLLVRLGKVYNIYVCKNMTLTKWLAKSTEERRESLPHYGYLDMTTILRTAPRLDHPTETQIVVAPESNGEYAIEHQDKLLEWTWKLEGPGWDVAEANKLLTDLAEKAQKEKVKTAKKKAKKDALSAEHVTEDSDDVEPTRDATPVAPDEGSKRKRQELTSDNGSQVRKSKKSRLGQNTSFSPVDHDGDKDTGKDVVTTPSTNVNDAAIQAHVAGFINAPTSQPVPDASATFIHDQLNLAAVNDNCWVATRSQPAKARSNYTKQCRTDRVQLVAGFCQKAGFPWVPQTHDELPAKLQYVSEAAHSQARKKASVSGASTSAASTDNAKTGGKKNQRE